MYIEKLHLINYRNYKEMVVNFSENINIFYGYNAQGKTNILEALYFTACARSHRTNKDKELIRWGENEGFISTIVKKKSERTKIDVQINKEHSKNIRINDIHIKKIGELFGNVNIVMFSPEDIKLIKEGPSERRRFIDIGISQIKPNYFYNLQQYIKIIHHRNALLKEIKSKKSLMDTLSIWDNNLIEIGSKLMYYRNVYLNKIFSFAKNIHKNISNEEMEIKYIPSILTSDLNSIERIKEDLSKSIIVNIEKDIQFGLTSVGPHRDSFDIYISGINIKTFGSQGQQRTAVLSLKLSEIEFFKNEIGEYPILLLDDVMSELDDSRQQFLIDNLDGIQVFITCTNPDKYRQKKSTFFKVSNGEIIKE